MQSIVIAEERKILVAYPLRFQESEYIDHTLCCIAVYSSQSSTMICDEPLSKIRNSAESIEPYLDEIRIH